MTTYSPQAGSASARAVAVGMDAVARRMQSIILLSGSVRSTGLMAAVGRSPLDLPIDSRRALRDLWRDAALDVARVLGAGRLVVRILADHDTPAPALFDAGENLDLRLERDASEFRGTGGILRDACSGYADDDWVLMASAAQLLTEPLGNLLEEMANTRGEIVLVSHADGTPSGLMLIRCGSLKLIPEVGFVDMREQALPIIAARHRVTVINRTRPTGLPLRTLSQYIAALRRLHAGAEASNAFAEDWFPSFAIVEDGAAVDPSARMHDSVVLRGARLGRSSTVVRCVICPGGVVDAGRAVVDELVTPLGKR